MATGNEPAPLSDEQNREIYESEIRPRLFAGKTGVETPTVAYVVGQSGAGKSTLIGGIKKDLSEENTVVLQRDNLRQHFPGYEEQLKAYGMEGAKFSGPDTFKWYDQAIEDAKKGRLNIVVENGFKDPRKSVAELEGFEGYRKEINVLGVHPETSWHSVNKRYEDEREQLAGMARFVKKESHDLSLEGIPKTLELLEAGKLADTITVYNREKQVMAQWNRGQDEGELLPSQVLRAKQTREPSAKANANYLEQWKALEQRRTDRNADPGEVQAAREEVAKYSARLKEREAEPVQATATEQYNQILAERIRHVVTEDIGKAEDAMRKELRDLTKARDKELRDLRKKGLNHRQESRGRARADEKEGR